MKLEKLNDILKTLSGENYLSAKLSKDDLLSDQKNEEDISLTMHIARKGLLQRAFEVLEKNGEQLTKEDILTSSLSKRSILSYAAEYDQLPAINYALQKTGETIEKKELLGSGYERDVAVLAAKNGKLGEILSMIAANGEKIEKKDVIDRLGYPNLYFRNMLSYKGWEPLAEEMRKQGFPITRDMAMDYGTGKEGRPFDTAIACGMLAPLHKELEQNGETFKKSDFTKLRGNKGQETNLLLKVLIAEEMPVVNNILKKNNEQPFTLDDIIMTDPLLFKDRTLAKVFGVKGFSDNPKSIKAFWEKIPEEKRDLENEAIYKKALRDAISKSVSPKIAGKARS